MAAKKAQDAKGKGDLVRQWFACNAGEEAINEIIDPESKGKKPKEKEVSKGEARSELFRLAAFMGNNK